VCGFNLKYNKKNTQVRELLGLEPVSLSIKRSRLQWFGYVERKDDADWLNHYMKTETNRTQQTSWDCVKDDMHSFELSRDCEDAQDRDH